MALISPGVEIQVFDDSAYASAATGTVPLIIIATAQDKNNITNTGIAAGTTKANAGKLAIVGSQRELATLYGAPYFERTSSNTPVHGGERNEYGLMSAYSLLGISNRVMAVRADIDTAQLQGTATRPVGKPVDGIYWLDTASTSWGLFGWNAGTQSFAAITPTVYTSATYLTGTAPSQTPSTAYGNIGDYAVVATAAVAGVATDPTVFYKTRTNTWVIVGSTAWQAAVPTVVSTVANPTLTTGNLVLNGITVAASGTSLGTLATAINTAAITGVTAATVGGFLEIYVTSAAKSLGSAGAVDGKLVISSSTIAVGSATGLAAIGLVPGSYNSPTTTFSAHTSVPRWRANDTVDPSWGVGTTYGIADRVLYTDGNTYVSIQASNTGNTPNTTPLFWLPVSKPSARPSGSVWVKTNAVNLGANLVLSKYNLSLNTFNQISTPLYANDQSAVAGLDISGGKLIPTGSIYTQFNTANDGTVRYKLFRRNSTWPTTVTGSVTAPTLVASDAFTIQVSNSGSSALTPATAYTITLPATPAVSDIVTLINAAGIPNLSAASVSGALSLTHALGGVIVLKNTTNTPLTALGITTSTSGVRTGTNSDLIVSNWAALTISNFTAQDVKPSQEPDDGTLWYYSTYSEVDIMIHDGTASKTAWKGYRTITSDARGFDLTKTDPNGVIISASKPINQSDGFTPVALGDLWLDTSDLENYPKISRWQTVAGVNRWVQIDNSDQTSEAGIEFADARWDTSGTTDVVTGTLVTTKSLLLSNYLDIDAPDATAYPRGTLLFNTRRSGYNVKKYRYNYFNSALFSFDNWSGTNTYAVNDRVIFTDGNIYRCTAGVTSAVTPPSDTTHWVKLKNSTWVTAAGNRIDGSPYMGHRSVRALVVAALKSAIDVSTEIREEQREFTLIACPGYPELIPNMVALNNDRRNTAFVIGDTSMRLAPVGTELQNWSEGKSSGNMYDEALRTSDNYLAVYYPSALFNDLTGYTIAVPPSHMALRSIVHSDNVSYPWFAPAGTKRGLVDNASSLGYINPATGEFTTFGMSVGIRDTLYETKINPITFLPGVGITVYGQKTRCPISSAFDRINVARLIAYIRGRVDKLARPFIFEPNDKITRDQLKQIVEQMLNDLTAKRALYDYLVVCDTTNNTPVRIDRNELYLDIAIEPVKAVEFIYIPLRIKNTGSITSNF